MAPTATETSDIEALLTVITREDIEGTVAQLRAAINVFLKNPKPSIAENAKSLLESIANKIKNVNAHAIAAHKTLDRLETACEAKARASLEQEKQKWTSYTAHLTDQLNACNRELVRKSGAQAQPSPKRARPLIEPDQKILAREAIRNAWSSIQPRIARLMKAPYQTSLEELKATLPLDRLGIPPQLHEQIYRITLARLLLEGNRWRKDGSPVEIYKYVYNVYQAMIDAAMF